MRASSMWSYLFHPSTSVQTAQAASPPARATVEVSYESIATSLLNPVCGYLTGLLRWRAATERAYVNQVGDQGDHGRERCHAGATVALRGNRWEAADRAARGVQDP